MWWWNREDYRGKPPRALMDSDISGWLDAADKRPKEHTRESIAQHIRRRNPIRWRNLQNDIKWVKKEMKKAGLNPEDWRYIV